MTETPEKTPGDTGSQFKAAIVCGQCYSSLRGGDTGIALECFCGAQRALEQLVDLKRAKDAGGLDPVDYERRKLDAWREAFRICHVIGEPAP